MTTPIQNSIQAHQGQQRRQHGVSGVGHKAERRKRKKLPKFKEPMKPSSSRPPCIQRKLSVCSFHAGSCQRWNKGSAATSPVTRSVVRPSNRTTSKLLR